MSKVSKSIETEKRLVIARGWGKMGRQGNDCYWVWVSLQVMKMS